MTSPENENPYQSPSGKESTTSDRSEVAVQPSTVFERVFVFLVALVVAIPVLAVTCAGGGSALLALDVLAATKRQQFFQNGMFFVCVASLILAVSVGGRVGRLLLRRHRSRVYSFRDDE